jgi:hypothetical protein
VVLLLVVEAGLLGRLSAVSGSALETLLAFDDVLELLLLLLLLLGAWKGTQTPCRWMIACNT